uniref:Uncharacterized protein n=2 Tax=Oryza TaxID=4527 RepID=Q7G3B9_ORYSJ|nr:hypothetical protein LOC_Os10g22270 [Oryza sativa Japonica Group]
MALDGDVASTIELLLNLIGNMDDTDVSDAHVFNFRFLFRLARPPFLMLLPSIGWLFGLTGASSALCLSEPVIVSS